MNVPFRKIALGTLAAFALVAAVPAESFAQSRHWHGHHRHWAGPAAAAGIIGGLALGALAASAYTYGPYPGGCVWRKQRTYDAWGRFVGFQPVQVCY
jgi:hypothetical protein